MINAGVRALATALVGSGAAENVLMNEALQIDSYFAKRTDYHVGAYAARGVKVSAWIGQAHIARVVDNAATDLEACPVNDPLEILMKRRHWPRWRSSRA
jgi:hypothetical protein